MTMSHVSLMFTLARQVLRKLVRVGVNIARFNAAHGTVQTHLASLAKLRKWVPFHYWH